VSRPRLCALIALVVATGLVALGMPGSSGATFVARTSNAVSSVTAAADWTPPTVSVRSPGSPVKDTVTVTADATDAESGIATVLIEQRASDASGWTTLCTATTSPWSCSWNTKATADGTYSLRAIATDRAGYATTSDVVSTIVANNVVVQLSSPGDIVRGNVTLTTTIHNPASLLYTVQVQYAVAGTGSWRTLCTGLLAPYTCIWPTTGSTSGESYDLRAVATAGSTTVTSAVVADVMVDNTAPTVAVTDPGSPLRGTVTLGATAADNESGIASVQVQHQRSGSLTWTTACTITLDPYTCRFDTTQLSDGTYALRAVATDAAGNTTTSATVGSRTVDNTVSAVSMEDPGAFLSGTVVLSAAASSTAGVTSVRIDRAPAGTTTWAAVCTDTAAPYSCSWATSTVADGLYDLRAVLVDGKGVTTTSTTVTNRRVDNSPLRGYDVQAVNGGTSAGRLDAGDGLRLTYTDQVRPESLSAGFTGAAVPVVVRLRDGNLLGLGARGDSVDVLRNGVAVNLGSVNLKQDYVKTNKSAQFNATMATSTTTVNGVTATTVTITLGTMASGTGLRTVTTAGTAVWTPSAAAIGLNGVACSAAPVGELGAPDREF
jgi:hypothetical protein